jgi:hypothetical protein
MGILKQQAAQGHKQEEHRESSHKKKNKGSGRPNPITYHWGVTRRLYGTLLQEGTLAAILAAPFWLAFKAAGMETVTISTNFWSLFLVMMMMFMLQSFMFRKGG